MLFYQQLNPIYYFFISHIYNIQAIETMISQQNISMNHKTKQGQYVVPQPCKNLQKQKQIANMGLADKELQRIRQQKKINFEIEDSDSGSQISFEQQLLQEHLNVINSKLETYQTCFGDISFEDNQSKSLSLKNFTLQQHLVQAVLPIYSCSPAPMNNFLQYLQKQSKFRHYLRHIYYTAPCKFTHQIVQLVFLIWNLYIPYAMMTLNLEEIKEKAISIAKKLWQSQSRLFGQLQKCKQKGAKDNSAKYRFNFILTMTTILVIQNIFKNPFYSSQECKYPTDAEAKQNQRGRKIIRLSTQN